MEIVEQTQNRLKIRHRPIGFWIMGGLIGASALVWIVQSLAWMPVKTRLLCSRDGASLVTCQLQQQSWIGVPRQQILYNVQSAEIRTRRRSRNTVSMIVLASPTRKLEVSNSQQQRSSVTEIQAFLSNPTTPNLELRYAEPTVSALMLMFPPLFLGLGIYLLRTPLVVCTFYRTLHKLVLEQQRLWQKQESEYALANILMVEIEEVKTKNGVSYRIQLKLRNGETLPLTADLIANLSEVNEIVTQIEQFLQE
jgi:hypothetical protein